MIGRKSLIVSAAVCLMLASGSVARAEDFGKTISGAFTSAYEGLRDGILDAYDTSRKGAVETYGDAKREANQAWREHGPSSASSAAFAPETSTVGAVQAELKAAGYDPGPTDGIYGPRTADAIRVYQRDNALPEDGQPSVALLEIMKAKRATSISAVPPAAIEPSNAASPAVPALAPVAQPASPGLPQLPGGQTAQRQAEGVGACRPFEQRTVIDGKETTGTGMACLQPNGTWKTIN